MAKTQPKLKSNWKDMREYIDFIEKKGQVIRVTEKVDPAWEINGITLMVTRKLGPCVIFENIKGSDYPLVTGLLASHERFLWALGMSQMSEFNEEWCRRTNKFIAPRIVKEAVCQEEEIKKKDIELGKICNAVWHKLDKSAFPGTLSISITKDPDSGQQNAGIYRMELQGRNELGWGAPEYTHGRLHYTKWERMNKPMPMAVVTGVDPTVLVVGATSTQPDIDEFHLCGALRQEPLEMVKCKTIDINVPATSEWVFEGHMYPGVRRYENTEWFGEYTGYYGEARTLPVFVVEHITHRKNPMYQGTREQWYPSESSIINGKTSQAETFRTLRGVVPGLIDLRCNVNFEAIAKIDKLFKGHPQQVMDAIWGATNRKYKHVIVVDSDIDIWDYESVHWAMSTRVKADRDVTITSRRSGQWLDTAVSLKERGWQSGLGIDATMPSEEYEFWGNKVPVTVDDPDIMEKAKAKWGKLLK